MARRGPYASSTAVAEKPATVSGASVQNPSVQPKADDSSKKGAFDTAVQNASNDQSKYQAAVEKAREEINGKDVSRDEFKRTIDKYFNESGASKTGREMRGENAWTDFVGGVNNAINGINTGIGTGVDAIWDNTIGNVAGLISKDLGDSVKNLATGEDLALVPDIASDIALTVAGLTPVVVAKEAFRNADNFKEAAEGKDSVTLEDLSDEQRIAKGGLGTLALALSAIPGVGKFKNIAKVSDKETAEGLLTRQSDKVAEKAAEATSKQEALEKAMTEEEAAAKAIETAQKAAKTPERQAIIDEYDWQLAGNNPENIADIEKYLSGLPEKKGIVREKAGDRKYSTYASVLDRLEKVPVEVDKSLTEASEAAAKKTASAKTNLEAAEKSAQEANKLEESAQKWADKSTPGRVLSTYGTDISSFAQALKNFVPSFRSGLKEVKTSKELSKKMQKANEALRDEMKKEKKSSKEITADDRRKYLMSQFGKSDSEEAAQATQKAYEQALKNSGWREADVVGEGAGLLAPKSVRRTRVMPGFLYGLQKAGEDIGFRGNTSYMRDVLSDSVDKTQRYARAYLPAEDATGLEGVKLMHELDKRNPGSIMNVIKGNAAGMFSSVPMVPLAYQANYGGDFGDAVMAAANDVEENPGAFLTAMFPLFAGRGLAVKGIPNIAGRLGSYSPYAMLRSKDVFENYNNNIIGEDSDFSSYEDALANIKKKG